MYRLRNVKIKKLYAIDDGVFDLLLDRLLIENGHQETALNFAITLLIGSHLWES